MWQITETSEVIVENLRQEIVQQIYSVLLCTIVQTTVNQILISLSTDIRCVT